MNMDTKKGARSTLAIELDKARQLDESWNEECEEYCVASSWATSAMLAALEMAVDVDEQVRIWQDWNDELIETQSTLENCKT